MKKDILVKIWTKISLIWGENFIHSRGFFVKIIDVRLFHPRRPVGFSIYRWICSFASAFKSFFFYQHLSVFSFFVEAQVTLMLNIVMVTFIAVTDFKIWATRNNYFVKKPTNSHREVFMIDKVWNANTFQAFYFNLLSRDKESSFKWSDMLQETIINSFGHCKRWLIPAKFN